MKINELIDVIEKGKNKLLKAEQKQEVLKKTLEIKEYLGIKQKRALVDSIINECILFDDGVFKFDGIDKYICFTMRTIEAYTNLELSEDMEDDYDLLCETQLLEMIVGLMRKEYDDMNVLLQMKSDYILSANTMEAQFGKFLDSVSEKLDVLVHVTEKKIDGFDIKNLPIDGDGLQKLMKFLGKQK